ncbi:SPOR domain-containing protein [Desulfococcus sp.]|uniref:SPOR domain-containing protein n=1 Tax=Desulfococcus sp. TaxID=2025834 RepID=UPI003594013E
MNKRGLKSRPLPRKAAREYTPPRERGIRGPIFRWGFLLFVAVWMFVLGIIVGRYATPVDFDPKRLEKELAELRAEEVQKEKERLKAEAKALYDLELDFYNALPSSAKTPAPEPAGVDDPGGDRPASPMIKRPLSTKHSAEARQEARTGSPPSPEAGGDSPVRAPKPAPSEPMAPEPAPRGIAADRLAIQVASFVTASDADRTVAMLKGKGYAGVYRTEDTVPGIGIRYRVRIAQFTDAASAREALGRLRNTDHFRDAYLFRR